MRRIKFRAFSNVNGDMMSWESIIAQDEGGDTILDYVFLTSTGDPDHRENELMQYTNLTDHWGNEVYEGDIIEQHKYPEGTRRLVEFTELSFGDAEIRLYTGWNVVLPASDWVVLGNKWQNPELVP